jgi:thymidylate synthase
MNTEELQKIGSNHKVAKKLLKAELELYCQGVEAVRAYNAKGIYWWDYCKPMIQNSYPKYFAKLPALINKINTEKRESKNYVLYIGETGVPTSQLPCLSLIQFQIEEGRLHMTVFQRSADASLGLPSDIYQMRLIAEMIDLPLENITFMIGNAHIYENNVIATAEYLSTGIQPKFALNV